MFVLSCLVVLLRDVILERQELGIANSDHLSYNEETLKIFTAKLETIHWEMKNN